MEPPRCPPCDWPTLAFPSCGWSPAAPVLHTPTTKPPPTPPQARPATSDIKARPSLPWVLTSLSVSRPRHAIVTTKNSSRLIFSHPGDALVPSRKLSRMTERAGPFPISCRLTFPLPGANACGCSSYLCQGGCHCVCGCVICRTREEGGACTAHFHWDMPSIASLIPQSKFGALTKNTHIVHFPLHFAADLATGFLDVVPSCRLDLYSQLHFQYRSDAV